MRHRGDLVTARRPESDLRRKWGIYCVVDDRWLPVVFQSMREAEEAVRILEGRSSC